MTLLTRDSAWSPRVAVAVGLVAIVLTIAAADVAGTVSWQWYVLVVVLGTVTLLHPDGHGGLLLFAVLALMWISSVTNSYTWWTLVAAWAFLLLHAALALAASTTSAARIRRPVWLMWGRQVVAVAVTTTGVWGLSWLVHQADLAGTAAVTLAAFVLLVAAIALLRAGSVAADSPSPK
ncbi:MAG: hypothetical protein ACRDPG_04735 [Nocardioidaceae bacterium]